MITDHIHYKLGNKIIPNNYDFTLVKKIDDRVYLYKSHQYSELYLTDEIIRVEIFLEVKNETLKMIEYVTNKIHFNKLKYFINSFANNEDEILFEDPLVSNSSFIASYDDILILLDDFGDSNLRLKFILKKD